MPSICLLACRMFEDELVHLIEEDRDSHVIIVENGEEEGVKNKLDRLSVRYSAVDEADISGLQNDNDEFTIVVYVLEFALDAKPDLLKEEVYRTVEKIAQDVDAILVLYGLCGNVLGSIEYDFRELDIPVRILKDRGGRVVDDCICAAFGDQAAYVNAMKGEHQGEGTYFLTPMQAVNWKEMLVATRMTPDPDDIQMTKMVFDCSGYRHVGKVDTGLHYEEDFHRTVEEFAGSFDFRIRCFEGSTEVVDECYRSIKEEISGKKSEKR